MKPLLFPDLYELLDDELRYVFDERAGIVEFDGRQPRETAECAALVELLREFPAAFVGYRALQIDVAGRPQWVLARPRLAEKLCTRHKARHVDLAEALDAQFGGLAVLSSWPGQPREIEHLI